MASVPVFVSSSNEYAADTGKREFNGINYDLFAETIYSLIAGDASDYPRGQQSHRDFRFALDARKKRIREFLNEKTYTDYGRAIHNRVMQLLVANGHILYYRGSGVTSRANSSD